MTISVVIPYRAGCSHREAAWSRVRDEWSGWHWYTTDDGLDPFSRAASINLAVSEHPADVYVIADADIIITRRQVETAVALANHSPGLVIAFDRWAHLTEEGTQKVFDDYRGSWEKFIDLTLDKTVSSCVALSEETWRLTGGFDPRFRAWGFEDIQLEVACATLAGPTRWLPGTAHHLWHPSEPDRPSQNLEMVNEYLSARDDPARMRGLLARV